MHTRLLLALLALLPPLAACASSSTAAASKPAPRVATFLMFEGRAEEALNFYASLFEDARIESVERYGPGDLAPEGSFKLGHLALGDQRLVCYDSPAPHGFTFTPSISLFVNCASQAELERLYNALKEKGEVLMPLDVYPFSRGFGWVSDRFGVSWQLNLPAE